MNRKYDYAKLEREYIAGDMSLRELAKSAGMSGHSLIMEYSRKNDWAKKRQEFRDRSANRALIAMADEDGLRVAKEARVRDNAIDTIDVAITRLRHDLQATTKRMRDGVWVEEPLIMVKPTDIALLIDRLQVLFGKPSTINEERNLGINLSAASNDPDFLRALVEATRGLGPDGGGMVGSPLPRIERTREN